jgi:Ni,Fe-hydrogenase I small subunit
MMCAEGADLLTSFEVAGIEVLWHPSLSEMTGREVLRLFDNIVAGQIELDILCLEGSVMTGPDGTGRFHLMGGTGDPMMAVIRKLAIVARYVFGGVTAAGGNDVGAVGLAYAGKDPGGLLGRDFRSGSGLSVVNIAGCPVHPNWVVETLSQIAMGHMDQDQLDDLDRPRSYADHLVHHGCPRNEFYEFKASAEEPSDLGCMMENLGCKGTQAHADCNTRLWNGEGSCLRGGYACINCTAPGFEEPGHAFATTPKFAGIPIGLPSDMPKAWFVALSSLAKAATPNRLRKNAVADHIVIPPSERKKGK